MQQQQQQSQQGPEVSATSRLAPPQQQIIGAQLGHNQIQHTNPNGIGQFSNSEQPDSMMNNILGNNNTNSACMNNMGGFMSQQGKVPYNMYLF